MGISQLIHSLSLFDKRVLLDQSELVTALHIMTNQTNISLWFGLSSDKNQNL